MLGLKRVRRIGRPKSTRRVAREKKKQMKWRDFGRIWADSGLGFDHVRQSLPRLSAQPLLSQK